MVTPLPSPCVSRSKGSMEEIQGIDALAEWADREIGVSGWFMIDQATIDAFADATGDHQWIHSDPKRAARGPFRVTIAHGLLLLSLIPQLASGVMHVTGVAARINYGYDRVRFPQSVPVGSRIRDRIVLTALEQVPQGARARFRHTIELEGSNRPACIADTIVHLVDGDR